MKMMFGGEGVYKEIFVLKKIKFLCEISNLTIFFFTIGQASSGLVGQTTQNQSLKPGFQTVRSCSNGQKNSHQAGFSGPRAWGQQWAAGLVQIIFFRLSEPKPQKQRQTGGHRVQPAEPEKIQASGRPAAQSSNTDPKDSHKCKTLLKNLLLVHILYNHKIHLSGRLYRLSRFPMNLMILRFLMYVYNTSRHNYYKSTKLFTLIFSK